MRTFGDSGLGEQRPKSADGNGLRLTGLVMDAINSLTSDRDGRVIA